jgi:hypothetical protein
MRISCPERADRARAGMKPTAIGPLKPAEWATFPSGVSRP